jgi:hypothetical protein
VLTNATALDTVDFSISDFRSAELEPWLAAQRVL